MFFTPLTAAKETIRSKFSTNRAVNAFKEYYSKEAEYCPGGTPIASIELQQ